MAKAHEHVWRHESVILGSKAYYSSWCIKCKRTDYEIRRDEEAGRHPGSSDTQKEIA